MMSLGLRLADAVRVGTPGPGGNRPGPGVLPAEFVFAFDKPAPEGATLHWLVVR